jgi:hypothetical protein
VTCTYLEAAPADLAGSYKWATAVNSNQSTSVPAPGALQTAIGTGYQNSAAIVDQTGNDVDDSAAVAARAYSGNSLTDWYLPSKDELRELCKFARSQLTGDPTVACDTTANVTLLYGFAKNIYWSSSEGDAGKAWSEGFQYTGFQNQGDKREGSRVRPVRAF